MFSKPKGQGALEYLLLIGGAVLIAVIVITLLLGVGETGENTTTNSAAVALCNQKAALTETCGGTVTISNKPYTCSGEFPNCGADFVASPGGPVCGDTTCDSPSETCSNCSADCGTCPPATFSCTGPDPANATLCQGDSPPLNGDLAKDLVASCGSPKCEYTCNSPTWSYDSSDVCVQCGDGVENGTEQCDGTDFGIKTCSSETGGSRPLGSLRCTSSCTVDATQCCSIRNCPIDVAT